MALDFQYDELMLENSAVRPAVAGNVTYGYEFDIRYPSYRGTFLSCIEGLTVKRGGKPIPAEKLRFTLNGKQFLITELSELCHEYWFVMTPAVVTVLSDGGASASAGAYNSKDVLEVEMIHRVPYTGYFGEYLTLTSHGSLKMA